MALKPLNSVGGFSVGEVPANVILANADITANKGTFVGNVAVSNTNAAYGILKQRSSLGFTTSRR